MKKIIVSLSLLLLAACGPNVEPYNYTKFYAEKPKSILIVPVLNQSNEAEAADFFLTTLPIPLAERGYYVFPTNMVKRAMEADGLSDPSLIHNTDVTKLASLFGTDSVIFVEILNWESKYVILSSNTIVKFRYTIRSGKTGEVLWDKESQVVHSNSGNSGNIFADLIATAILGAIDSMKSDFTPLAQQANAIAIAPAMTGLPFGPYNVNKQDNPKHFPIAVTATDEGKEAKNKTDDK